MGRIKFVENALNAMPSGDEKIAQGLKEISELLGNTGKPWPS